MTEKSTSQAKNKLVVALDFKRYDRAFTAATALKNIVGGFKIGTELAGVYGWQKPIEISNEIVQTTIADAKLHDSPSTMARTLGLITWSNPDFATVHVSQSTEDAVKYAKEFLDRLKKEKQAIFTRLLGVTVLTTTTSLDSSLSMKQLVKKRAAIAVDCGLEGIITSPREVEAVRAESRFDKLLIFTPGIRPQWAEKNDQKRTLTPRQAIEAGSDYLIVGRPITRPPDGYSTGTAAKAVIEEIQEAL